MMLTGEWGCGKTHLIENDLTDALGQEFIVVRVSLFGINNSENLHEAVKKAWMLECSPVSSDVMKKYKNNWGLKQTLKGLFQALNVLAGSALNGMVSVNIMDLISIQPTIDDFKTRKKKKIILAFDDLERSKMDLVELLGSINEYSENQHFNTIIVANEEYYIMEMEDELSLYNILKEKIVAYTVLHKPDFDRIIHNIISKTKWQSQEYCDYLTASEGLILDLFKSAPGVVVILEEQKMRKSHNLRTLRIGLENFYRIFVLLKEAGESDIDRYLYTFLAFTMAAKSGIYKKGRPTFDAQFEDIKTLYPKFSEDAMPDSLQSWILLGDWDEKTFLSELNKNSGQ